VFTVFLVTWSTTNLRNPASTGTAILTHQLKRPTERLREALEGMTAELPEAPWALSVTSAESDQEVIP
jgi:hypothetical protein